MAERKYFPIIKVVGNSCNLACDYCFYSGKERMPLNVISDELMESFIAQFLEISSRQIRLVWHGGEPLLAGVPFFERIVSYERKYQKDGDSIENLIQTNGTLIDNSWAEFFRDNKFRVGVSLDGGKESHDRFRKNCADRGSFERTMRGIEVLRKFGVTPGIIQTLTRANLVNLEKDFHFFVDELEIKGWAINIYDAHSSLNGEMWDQGLSDADVEGVYRKIIELWLRRNDPSLCIREIENFIPGVVGRRARNCSFNGSCANYFCLDSDGLVYPCDRLSNNESLALGDLKLQPLREILDGEPAKDREEAVCALSEDCKSCEWVRACNNGCLAMRARETGKFAFCNARRQTFDYLRQLVYIRNEEGL